MEYVPETLYRGLKNYSNTKQGMSLIYVKLYTYQGARVHSLLFGICHRDVKPQFFLVGRAFGWESSSVFWSRSCCSWPSHCTPSGKISNHVDSLASLCSILLTSCGIMYEAL
ncbi:shaggy-related protein kinase epsilon-like [Aegilops tauschii subsp. strangulata]|uniref:Uncharacterized protein n=1 Tax=Aegilops tauschii subsp. strangulata TaxID=200361 RepID=A0A453F6A3_AEGTS